MPNEDEERKLLEGLFSELQGTIKKLLLLNIGDIPKRFYRLGLTYDERVNRRSWINTPYGKCRASGGKVPAILINL